MKLLFTSLLTVLVLNFSFAQTSFSEVAQTVGISAEYLNLVDFGGGAAFFDYDNDGWEDLWVTRGLQPDKLYRNNGDGTFTDASQAIIDLVGTANTMGVSTADLNNDGFRDVLLNTFIGAPDILLQNNGDGTFTDITVTSGLAALDSWSISATFGDANKDGLLDIYVGNYIWNPVVLTDSLGNITGFAHECSANWLLMNEGLDMENTPSFTLVNDTMTTSNLGCALAATFTDFDQDKDPDLFIVNDFGEWGIPNRLLENNMTNAVAGSGFDDVSEASSMDTPMNGMGIAIGDYDQDNDLDYYVTNIGVNKLFQNQQDGSFLNKTNVAGVEDIFADSLLTVGWGTFFADVDNDTDLDLFVSNGYTPTAEFIASNPLNPNRLFINQLAESQQANFTDYSTESGVDSPQRGRGCAFADYDKDGDLDYIVVNVNAGAGDIEPITFYRNELDNENNWLQVQLVGTSTNRDAFGTQMRVVVGDKSWRYEVDGGSTHASQNSSIAHFGLGTADRVDSLYVFWPNSEPQVFTNLFAKQRITIEEGSDLTTSVESPSLNIFQLAASPNPLTQRTLIDYELPNATTVSFNFYTVQGVLMDTHTMTMDKGKQQFNWDASNLPAGLYLLRLQTADGQQQSIRLTKQ
ncbi:MAG: FG-GAP-like repeat-containing protein [Bacteroidota bacterium]